MSTSAPADTREQAALGCPFCGGAGRHLFSARDRNRAVSTERFDYEKCAACATVYMPAPPADLARYYAGDYYLFDGDGEPRWKSEPEQIAAAEDRVVLLRDHVRPGT
jgi:hypothetical protein